MTFVLVRRVGIRSQVDDTVRGDVCAVGSASLDCELRCWVLRACGRRIGVVSWVASYASAPAWGLGCTYVEHFAEAGFFAAEFA
jgi:hypothetical protein